ncbi:hypothetical protein Tco_0650104 [Tanacetum coccineum]
MVVLMLSYSIKVMDPNSSLGKICLGENVVEISSDKVEGSRDWNSPEFQDTANSGQKKETKAMVFYQMDTEEVSDRFVAPCFVNGLEAYDGEINLGVEENMISNEYAVKLCLEHEVKRGNKVVKKELIVALRGEFYFVKFIINPEEDDVEPGVILGRSFLRMTKAITDFGAGTVTIYPEIDPFLEDIEEEEKSLDDWDHLLDFNLDDVPLLGEEELPPFVCKMGEKTSHQLVSITQEEAAKEALAIRMSRKFALLEEERPIIETMAYHDKYKKILDEIWKDKVELDGKIVKEEEEAVKRIKGVTTLIAKFLILNILIDRDEPIVVGQRFLRTIGGIVNTQERLFLTFDGFCHQTFCAARSYVMRNAESDIPLKHVNWKPDYKGSYTKEEEATGQWRTEIRLTDPYGNIYLQGFTTKKIDRKLSKYHKLSDIMSPNWFTMGTHDDEAGSSRSKRSRQNETVEENWMYHADELEEDGFNVYFEGGKELALKRKVKLLWTIYLEDARKAGVNKGCAYNPPSYAQPQYDQYYQQYPPPLQYPPQYQQQQDDDDDE